MRAVQVCSMLVAAGLVAACDAPTRPDAPADAALAARGAVVGFAAGGGKAQLPPGFTLLSFSFTARQHADGSAGGNFRQLYESAGGTVDFEGEVTCVSFDPAAGRAWVGGVVTRNSSTNPAVQTAIHEVGDDVWFRVVDNGEGEAAADDRTTVFGFEGAAGVITSAEYCARQLWTAGDVNTWAVVEGNLQVRR